MSDDEIKSIFCGAKNKKPQVQILAELNAVSRDAMAEKLRELGCDVPELPEVKQKPLRAKEVLFDETRARMLFNEGKSDLECAEMLGISTHAFATWRRRKGMKRAKGGAAVGRTRAAPPSKPCKTQPPTSPESEMSASKPVPFQKEPEPVSAVDVGKLLLDIGNRYPGMTLTINGNPLRAVCLNVRVVMNGEDAMSSTLDLEVVR